MKYFKKLLLGAMIIASSFVSAQPQKKLWSSPTGYMKFNPGPTAFTLPTIDYSGSYFAATAHNAMHDANDNLLFFVTDEGAGFTLYDGNGRLIGSPTFNGLNFNGGSEIAIIPVPSNCNKYYLIFELPFYEPPQIPLYRNRFGYITLDMSLSNGNGGMGVMANSGAVTALKEAVSQINSSISPLHVAVTPFRAATNDRILFATQGGILYKFYVTSTGFTELASSGTETMATGSANFPNRNELEVIALSNGNYRLGMAAFNDVGVMDFNSSGVYITNTRKSLNLNGGVGLVKYIYGLEFSPNGTYLYIEHEQSPYMQYIDVTQATLSTTSLGSLSSASIFDDGQIELGFDGKLYFASASQLGSLPLNVNGTPNTGSWNNNVMGSIPYLNDQIDGEIYYPPTPTISGNNFACSTGTETYTLGGSYSSTVAYQWTITGGTPTSFITIGTTSSQAITWTSAGGTITVRPLGAGGCSPAATFTVNPCCRRSDAGKTVVYFNNKVENAAATYTPTSNNGASPPVGTTFIYVVNGTYTINANAVTFSTNCQVYLAKDVPVYVNSGGYLKLLSGTVWQAGCNDMWEGITVYSGGNLLVDASTIKDAKLAIKSVAGAPFTVQNGSKLNLNYKNIRLETYGSTHPGVIKNSRIACEDGSFNPVSTLLPPYSTAQGYSGRTYIGIETDNVSQVNIGVDASGQTNTFNNMDIGINNWISGLTVYNNTFTNITFPASGNPNGRCISSDNTTATEKSLVVGGSANIYQKNTFTNSYNGVVANTNQDVTIVANTFNNIANRGVYIYYCANSGNSVSIQQNNIDDCQTGIYSLGSGGSTLMDVSNNNINLAAPTGNSKPNSTAITITNASLGTIGTFNILNNTIKRVTLGIEVTNFNTPDISDNTLTSLSDISSSYPTYGIIANVCPSANIESNLVKGPSSASQSSWWMYGIRLESGCSSSKVLYNGVEDIGRGLMFSGSSTGVEVARNNMKTNLDGLVLNSSGIIGTQLTAVGAGCKASENTWQGTFSNSHIYSYYSDGTQSPFNLLNSTHANWVADMKTPGTIVSDVFPTSGSPYFAVPTYTCNTTSGYTGTHRSMQSGAYDQLKKLAKDKINFPIFDASSKWWAKYNLYHLLKTDASFLDEPELSAFADSVSHLNFAKIYQINETIGKGESDLADVASMVSSFNPGNAIEQYMKDVYTITIASRINEGLNENEIEQLKKIAELCPYESGPAVYNARVLLSMVDNTSYANSCEVIPVENGKGRSMEEENIIGKGISVFPNPANDKLNVAIYLSEGQTATLKVYDLAGKLVLTNMFAENTEISEISTSELSEGMYIYKLDVNNSPVRSGKLSIIR